nr:odorant binding protein 14 [Aromia bungii]
MKVVFVFASLVALSMAMTEMEHEKCKKEDIHKKCQSNPATYAPDEYLDNLPKYYLDNPQVGAHMLCESQGLGLQDKDGKLNYRNIKRKVKLSVHNEDKANKLVKECAVQRKTKEKTAVYLFMCLDKHGVTYFHEF